MTMKTMKIIRSSRTEQIAKDIASQINNSLLNRKSVLWLLSGGSALDTAVRTRELLNDDALEATKLTVGLIDERYGEVGHLDSNWAQLLNKGFNVKNISPEPILQNNVNLPDTADAYAKKIQKILNSKDVIIGLFGIGPDGHTAGLFPNSKLLHSSRLYDSLIGNDYPRISSTPELINQINWKYIYAVGDNKALAVNNMLKDGPIGTVPARILKNGKSVKLYTNVKRRNS